MKHSQEEIVNALKVIKETCEDAKECADFPIYREDLGYCNFKYNDPQDWKINFPYKVWRAFNG